jgi:RimJ/RimL family protein N-acetyltransferase
MDEAAPDHLVVTRAARDDEHDLARLFAEVDATWFHPHELSAPMAHEIANYAGRDVHLVGRTTGSGIVAYGLLRGWDDGYDVPSLGIYVRADVQGRGYGRRMMESLHQAALDRGADRVRLRVHPGNERARRLYDALGYREAGEDRGETVMTRDLEQRR